jgi:hypothetical protein
MQARARLFLKTSATALCALASVATAQDAPPPTQSFPLTDASALVENDVKITPAEYNGRKAIRLTREATDSDGFATIKGTNFRDGSIDVDLATVPDQRPGGGSPGFVGIIFRIGQAPSHYDGFYIRPGNSVADDQARRNHSVQYIAAPGYGWEKLRRTWPAIYESWTDIQPLAWNHIRIEVHGRKASLFLNGSSHPSLVIDGLKGEDLQGPVALWTFSEEQSYFANLKIENVQPAPIQNGGEIAGTWDTQFITDAGGFPGTLKLVRQGSTIAGIYAGPLGSDQPVYGTWRDGYVELTFSGTWPDEPGAVTATMAGWVDGDSAGGRTKVQGRADGRWIATRQK